MPYWTTGSMMVQADKKCNADLHQEPGAQVRADRCDWSSNCRRRSSDMNSSSRATGCDDRKPALVKVALGRSGSVTCGSDRRVILPVVNGVTLRWTTCTPSDDVQRCGASACKTDPVRRDAEARSDFAAGRSVTLETSGFDADIPRRNACASVHPETPWSGYDPTVRLAIPELTPRASSAGDSGGPVNGDNDHRISAISPRAGRLVTTAIRR